MTELRVLAIARDLKEEVNNLLDTSRKAFIDAAQLRDSVNGISANIREANGRRVGAERNQFYRVARSCSEETDEHLYTNRVTRRLAEKTFWQFHNRIAVIVKMLNRLMTK